jgi:hypothetical protein
MRFKMVLIRVRENERILRRRLIPGSVHFQVRLFEAVLRDLERMDGHRSLWHVPVTLLALLLRDMGVVATGHSFG